MKQKRQKVRCSIKAAYKCTPARLSSLSLSHAQHDKCLANLTDSFVAHRHPRWAGMHFKMSYACYLANHSKKCCSFHAMCPWWDKLSPSHLQYSINAPTVDSGEPNSFISSALILHIKLTFSHLLTVLHNNCLCQTPVMVSSEKSWILLPNCNIKTVPRFPG